MLSINATRVLNSGGFRRELMYLNIDLNCANNTQNLLQLYLKPTFISYIGEKQYIFNMGEHQTILFFASTFACDLLAVFLSRQEHVLRPSQRQNVLRI